MKTLLFVLACLVLPVIAGAQIVVPPGRITVTPVMVMPANAVDGSGAIRMNLLFSPDNTWDIGGSSSTLRPRNAWVSQDVKAGNALLVGSGGRLMSPSDGVIRLGNGADTDFARLQFGGTTSSFPALKRNGATIQARLADDSGYAAFLASEYYANGAAITIGVGTGITVNNAGALQRQVYKVTIDRTAFIAAALTADVTIATLPAKTVLLGVYADLTTVFACTGTCTSSTLSMTLGSSVGLTDLLVSFDADAAIGQFGDADAELGTSLTRATAVQGGKIVGWATTPGVFLRLTSSTGNIGNGSATNLSQGSVTFYLITERLP